MIKELNHRDKKTAEQIHAIWQASYAIEAELLATDYFPPLERKVSDFLESSTSFLGFWKDGFLAAVLEIKADSTRIHLQSLVVHPAHFRQGIATQLIKFALKHYHGNVFWVETGVANTPAVTLYTRLGFTEVRQWETEYGIRKVGFRLYPSNKV